MSESYQWDFGSAESGLQFNIVFNGSNFTVTCTTGYMDLNALWFSDGDKSVEGTVTLSKADSSLNLNGTGITWDDYYKVSSTGLGTAGTDKVSYLTAGESMSFSVSQLDLPPAIQSLLSGDPSQLIIGVRATSTSSGDGKFVDSSGTLLSSYQAPTLAAVSGGTLNDTAGDDSFADLTGKLTGTVSAGHTLSFQLAGATATPDGTEKSAGFDLQQSTAYGTLYLSSASGDYKFVANDVAVEALKSSHTLDFVVNATDGSAASATQTLTVTLNGVNDAPTLNAVSGAALNDTAGDDSFADLSGQLTGSDRDGDPLSFELAGASATPDGAEKSAGFDIQKTTDYGTLYLSSASGDYKFVANAAAVEALKTTQTLDFVVNATDGSAASAAQTLTVTLNGVNDAPTLNAVSGAALNDTAGDDSFADLTGQLTGSDRDGDPLSFALAGASATPDGAEKSAGFDLQQGTAYGTLYLSSASGDYKFVANDAAVEALKTTQTLDFVVNATDGSAASATQTLTITLNGVNDAPTLNAVSGGALNDTAGDDSFADLTGQLSGSDRDGDPLSFELAGATATPDGAEKSAGFDVQKNTDYGTLYLSSTSGDYKFVANDAAVEALKSTQTLDFVVNATDGSAASATQTLTVTLNGVNDTPELSASLTAHSYTDTVADDSFASLFGTLTTQDRDANETASYAIAGAESGSYSVGGNSYEQRVVGSYGTLYLNASGAYQFVPDDAAIEKLESGDSKNESFTLSVTDGSGASASQDLTIHVSGAEDRPVLGAVSFAYRDSMADDSFAAASGMLQVSSRDGDTSFTFALAGSSASSLAGYDLQNAGSGYGTLYLNSGTGEYRFVANDAAIEGLQWGSNPHLSYGVTATADGVTSDSQSIGVDLIGANDAPRDIALLAVSTFANGNGTPGSSTAIGTLSVPAGSDPDSGGSYSFSLDGAKVGTLGAASITTDASALFSVSSAGALGTTAAGGLADGSIYEVTVKVAQGAGDTLASYSETFSIVTGTNASSESLPGSGFDFSGGDDLIYGRQNIDIIYAGSGNDTVFGQGGNDEIHGGTGVDLLFGGNNNDTFVFASGDTGITLASADTIADFSSADDVIATSLAANNVTIANGSGLADFAAFVTAANGEFAAAGGHDAYMAWNAAGSGNGWLAIDENGSGALDNGDTLIMLTGVNTSGEFAASDIA